MAATRRLVLSRIPRLAGTERLILSVLNEGEQFALRLADRSGGPLKRGKSAPAPRLVERGKALYHAVGCVACHEPFIKAPKHKIDPSAVPDDGERKARVGRLTGHL